MAISFVASYRPLTETVPTTQAFDTLNEAYEFLIPIARANREGERGLLIEQAHSNSDLILATAHYRYLVSRVAY